MKMHDIQIKIKEDPAGFNNDMKKSLPKDRVIKVSKIKYYYDNNVEYRYLWFVNKHTYTIKPEAIESFNRSNLWDEYKKKNNMD
jgi:hypothetical protein